MIHSFRKVLTLSVLSLALLGGCSGKKNSESRPADNAGNTTSVPSTSQPDRTVEPTAGSKLNDFFPKDADGYDVVFTQEKDGFSQAKLQKDGKDQATLTIADVANDKGVTGEYGSSSAKVGNYPMLAKGSQGTAVLVANRFQVQVRSTDKSFSEAQRKEWLQKFDLNGLSSMK